MRTILFSLAAAGMAACALAGSAPDWRALRLTVPEDQRPGYDFLVAHMPARDRAALDPAVLMESLDAAYRARAEFPWAKSVPEDLFLNDVLPYAFITETRDSWRPVLYAKVAPLARAAATRRDAIVAINRDIVKLTGVKYTPAQRPPQQSPLESISFGTAGAPGLSILLAAAFRSAGLPARLCGTPRWGDLSGDHLWVEVWDDGWHFTEYYPDEGGLDHGWIPEKAALADPDEPFQRVVATTWKPGDELFRMAWAPGDLSVPAVNRTAHYAALAGGRRVHVPEEEGCLAIRVFARAGGPQVAVPIVARQSGVEMKRGTTPGAPAGRDDFFAVCGEPSLPMSLEYGGKTREVKFEAGKTTSVDLLLEP